MTAQTFDRVRKLSCQQKLLTTTPFFRDFNTFLYSVGGENVKQRLYYILMREYYNLNIKKKSKTVFKNLKENRVHMEDRVKKVLKD